MRQFASSVDLQAKKCCLLMSLEGSKNSLLIRTQVQVQHRA